MIVYMGGGDKAFRGKIGFSIRTISQVPKNTFQILRYEYVGRNTSKVLSTLNVYINIS